MMQTYPTKAIEMVQFLVERLTEMSNKKHPKSDTSHLIARTKRALFHLILTGSFDGKDVFFGEIKTHKSRPLESHPKINEKTTLTFGLRKRRVADQEERQVMVSALRAAARISEESADMFPSPYDQMCSIFPTVLTTTDFCDRLQVLSDLCETPKNKTHAFLCLAIYWLWKNAVFMNEKTKLPPPLARLMQFQPETRT